MIRRLLPTGQSRRPVALLTPRDDHQLRPELGHVAEHRVHAQLEIRTARPDLAHDGQRIQHAVRMVGHENEGPGFRNPLEVLLAQFQGDAQRAEHRVDEVCALQMRKLTEGFIHPAESAEPMEQPHQRMPLGQTGPAGQISPRQQVLSFRYPLHVHPDQIRPPGCAHRLTTRPIFHPCSDRTTSWPFRWDS